jgi:hypothetical protein
MGGVLEKGGKNANELSKRAGRNLLLTAEFYVAETGKARIPATS